MTKLTEVWRRGDTSGEPTYYLASEVNAKLAALEEKLKTAIDLLHKLEQSRNRNTWESWETVSDFLRKQREAE